MNGSILPCESTIAVVPSRLSLVYAESIYSQTYDFLWFNGPLAYRDDSKADGRLQNLCLCSVLTTCGGGGSLSSHFWKGFIKWTASNKITRARDAEDLFLPKITMTLGHPSCVAVRGYMGKGAMSAKSAIHPATQIYFPF